MQSPRTQDRSFPGADAVPLAGSMLRIAMAGLLVWFCWQDWPAGQAWSELEGLPDYDYRGSAERLLSEDRFSEALLVADAGIAAFPGQQDELLELRGRIAAEQASWMRRFQEVGRGALHGTGRSAEALGGAIVADLFVFGDVRDLVIQAGRRLRGEQTDPVIVGLSAGGILLTVNPALDLGAALLKFARKVGAMTDAFAKSLVRLIRESVKRQNADDVLRVTDDMAALAKQARPAGAITILRGIDSPEDLRVAARFAQRPDGAFTLWVGGRGAIAFLKEGGEAGAPLLARAARKGPEGISHLARKSAVLLRPHPLLGLVKGFYKGNIPDALLLLARRYSLILLGLAAAWLAFEIVGLASGLGRERRPTSARAA